jgi:hypothetical protein
MTKEDVTNLVFARLSPGKGEEAAGELKTQIYAAIDKALRSLAIKVSISPNAVELQKTFDATVINGEVIIDSTILPSKIVNIFVEGSIGGELLNITPTYVSQGGVMVATNELWGDGSLNMNVTSGAGVNDSLVSPSSPGYPSAKTYGLLGDNSHSDLIFELNNYVNTNIQWSGATTLNIGIRSKPENPSVKEVIWYYNGNVANIIFRSSSIPQFPLRPMYSGVQHGGVVLSIATAAVTAGQAVPAPSYGEMQSLSVVNQHFYVVEGSKLYLRTITQKQPTNAIKVKANYVPDLTNLPTQFDEDLIEEVIIILGRGGNNGSSK